jgi:hypothetical protein
VNGTRLILLDFPSENAKTDLFAGDRFLLRAGKPLPGFALGR